jgi:hypothetical protein
MVVGVRIFLAGVTGVLGMRLVPLPAAAGHEVVGRTRSPARADQLAAARAAGAVGFLAQSVAWRLAGDAGAATEELERSVLAAGGAVLRYGQFFGPGTYHEQAPPRPPRIHVEEAARRTVAAPTGTTGVLTIVED